MVALSKKLARYTSDGSLDVTFDGDGRVITHISGHDGARSLALGPDGKITAAGNSGTDFSVARYAGSERVYAMQDANFNVTGIADRNGSVIERYQYDPYGSFTVLNANWTARATNVSQISWQHFHQGGRLDVNAGVYHFNIGGNGRDYSPILGRWLEVDRHPSGPYVDGMSGYEYVTSNPATMNDPQGWFGRRTISTTAGTDSGSSMSTWRPTRPPVVARPAGPSILGSNPLIQAQVTRVNQGDGWIQGVGYPLGHPLHGQPRSGSPIRPDENSGGGFYKWLYTGQWNASDAAYEAAIAAAGDYLYRCGSVRGFAIGYSPYSKTKRLGAGKGAKFAVNLGGAWTMDEGYAVTADVGVSVGAIPSTHIHRRPGDSNAGVTVGVGGSWSQDKGSKLGGVGVGLWGGDGNPSLAGGNVTFGIGKGPVSFGLIVDPSRIWPGKCPCPDKNS